MPPAQAVVHQVGPAPIETADCRRHKTFRAVDQHGD